MATSESSVYYSDPAVLPINAKIDILSRQIDLFTDLIISIYTLLYLRQV